MELYELALSRSFLQGKLVPSKNISIKRLQACLVENNKMRKELQKSVIYCILKGTCLDCLPGRAGCVSSLQW